MSNSEIQEGRAAPDAHDPRVNARLFNCVFTTCPSSQSYGAQPPDASKEFSYFIFGWRTSSDQRLRKRDCLPQEEKSWRTGVVGNVLNGYLQC